jgi:type I restriction enzyme, S subunit
MRWPMATLAELCEINIGRTPSRSERSYWGAGHPWLSIADMNQGRNLRSTREQITEAAADAVMGTPSSPGTVMFSFKLSIGRVGISAIPLYTNEAIASLPIRDDRRMLPEFLYWALRSSDLTAGANRAAMGNTLNKAQLQSIEVPLPPIEEQRRITNILDRADGLRAKRHQALAHLDALAHRIFFDTSVHSVGKLMTLAEAGVALESGKNLVAEPSDEHPMNRVIKVSAISRGVFDPSQTKPLPRYYVPPSSHRIQQGDILFGRASGSLNLLGATLQVESVPEHLFLPDKVWRVVVHGGATIERDYLLGLLQSSAFKSYVRHNASGAAGVRNIGQSRVLAFKFDLPPIYAQKQYGSLARSLRSLRTTQNRQLEELEALLNGVQQRAFAGTL